MLNPVLGTTHPPPPHAPYTHAPRQKVGADSARLAHTRKVLNIKHLAVGVRVLPHKLLDAVVPAWGGGDLSAGARIQCGAVRPPQHGLLPPLHPRPPLRPPPQLSARSARSQRSPLARSLGHQGAAGLVAGAGGQGAHHRVQAAMLAGGHSGGAGSAVRHGTCIRLSESIRPAPATPCTNKMPNASNAIDQDGPRHSAPAPRNPPLPPPPPPASPVVAILELPHDLLQLRVGAGAVDDLR